jgi:cyanophycinase
VLENSVPAGCEDRPVTQNGDIGERLRPGPIALVGSGEYLPVLEFLERALIAGRPPRYAQLATAAAPEGPASLARWHALGADAARRLGVEQVVVRVRNREDADDPVNGQLVAGAGLIYLSGGNPTYLTEALRGTRVWAGIVDAWRNGAALAGCSAGAMALSAGFPGFRRPWRPSPGLGLVPVVRVVPHFDRFGARLPDVALRGLARDHGGRGEDGALLVGIDEETALVGGLGADGWEAEPAGPGNAWQVLGRGSAWLLGPGGRTRVASGESVVLPVPAAA